MSWELDNFESYVDFTDTTAIYPGAGKATQTARDYAMLGLIGEAGELANRMKKLIRGDYGDGATLGREQWREQMVGELGGLFYYIARQCREWQMTGVQEVWERFADAKPWDLKDVDSCVDAILALHVNAAEYVEDPSAVKFGFFLASAFEVTYGLGYTGNFILSDNVTKLMSRKERDVIKGDGDDR